MDDRAALADDDAAGCDDLPAVALDAEALRLRIAAVARAAACLFVCHGSSFRVLSILLGLGDAGDLDLRVGLPMSAKPFRVLAPTELENHHLVGKAVSEDLGFDGGAFHDRRADFERLAFADEEHLVEHELAAHLRRELFDPELFALGNPVLLAPGSDHCVHDDLRPNTRKTRNYTCV